jgi:hypothetical protein
MSTVTYDNLVEKIQDTKGVTLASGVSYEAGMVLVSQDTVKWTNADVVAFDAAAATPQLSGEEQEIGVLLEDVDATLADAAGVVATGTFNENSVTLPGTQTKAEIAGVLQAKGVYLKEWSK